MNIRKSDLSSVWELLTKIRNSAQAASDVTGGLLSCIAGEVEKCEGPSDSQPRRDVLESFEKLLLTGDFSIRDGNIWTRQGLVGEKRPRESSGRNMET